VAGELGGAFPQTAEGLQALPGIGRYTAGAIASIAFGEAAPVLDGNVMRVFARLDELEDDVTLPATQARLWALAEARLDSSRPGDFNQALMELGRVVCRPRAPRCGACPVAANCLARERGTQDARPVKGAKAATPHYDVAAGMIWNEAGELLIAQRPLDGLLGGLWEFPGGKQEVGETLPECLARELREELAIEVDVGELFTVVRHGFTHFKITLHAFTCRYRSGDPQPLGVAAFAWVRPERLDDYAFGKADRAVIAALRARQGMLL
jgi:A/G-specific adenine glycosylase